MFFVKKMHFSNREIESMTCETGGYVWAAVDVRRNVIAAGDEFVGEMKNALLRRKSSIGDVYGVGMDTNTGEIEYRSPINAKLMDAGRSSEVPLEKRGRIETLLKYFFLESKAVRAECERKSEKRADL